MERGNLLGGRSLRPLARRPLMACALGPEQAAGIGKGAPPRVDGVTEIDAAGRVVMPGLIDAHAHLSIVDNIAERNRGALPVRFLKIAREIEETLRFEPVGQ